MRNPIVSIVHSPEVVAQYFTDPDREMALRIHARLVKVMNWLASPMVKMIESVDGTKEFRDWLSKV